MTDEKQKHTPGPWKIDIGPGLAGEQVVGADGLLVADCAILTIESPKKDRLKYVGQMLC